MSGGGADGEGWGDYARRIKNQATQYAASSAQGDGTTREPGSRRKKLAGALQAAKELQQSYYAGYASRNGAPPRDQLPPMGTVRSANEELWLFPSYARMLSDSEREAADGNIVAVDVRGWLFKPHSGPLNRKSRLSIYVARYLCGLPTTTPGEDADADELPTAQEKEDAKKIASEVAHMDRDETQAAEAAGGLDGVTDVLRRRASWRSDKDTDAVQIPIMSPSQIRAACKAFEERLAPFTHVPIQNLPVTIFFYNATNNTQAQSRSVYTSDSGHFAVRTSLPFMPTHVRVLASEDLSATEEISVHPREGVSVISDIDDTVKHSGISQGNRTVMRNTFAAPVKDFLIPGVSDWYQTLAAPPYNVNFHYVSNSPWQLYPMLRSFFDESGLPAGSFHLKQYTGVLQGIFEPPAERKKGTVEKVVEDFPDRKWILIGDSGEADLEVYSEIAEKYPDRIIAICIRDVTTDPSRDYDHFDPNNTAYYSPSQHNYTNPPLPPRPATNDERPLPAPRPMPSANLRKEPSVSSLASNSTLSISNISLSGTPPPRPEKPTSLRGPQLPPKPSALRQDSQPPPPPPPRRRTTMTSEEPPLPPPPRRTMTGEEPPPPPPPRRTTTMTMDGQPPAPPPPRRMTTNQQQPQMFDRSGSPEPPLSKAEETWFRRWFYARDWLAQRGIPVMTWRQGGDLKRVTTGMVERELKRQGTRWKKD